MPRHRRLQNPQTAPLDGIALSLAVWLGLVAGVTSLVRLSEHAALDAELARATHHATPLNIPAPKPEF